ncbi:fimbrial protein [Serratia proteamaculans]|jgi:hypothetical protein|uniref:fimbrial protein n=2 Tax=Serratia proteamaculans TaxID=28151 RepID=UPI0028F6DDA3|nr:fimbrial protein [Serratia proteamaculans]
MMTLAFGFTASEKQTVNTFNFVFNLSLVSQSTIASPRVHLGTGRWNTMGMGTTPISSLSYTATCVARNVTPLVILPTISVSQLTAGQTSQAQFTINIECDNAAVSGVSTNNTALGLQVPYDSYAAAQQLGLVNANGGVSYLLSSGYGSDSSVATGVGIALSNASNGTPINFVGWARCSSGQCPQSKRCGLVSGTQWCQQRR